MVFTINIIEKNNPNINENAPKIKVKSLNKKIFFFVIFFLYINKRGIIGIRINIMPKRLADKNK
jgi:hypothetical protein